MKFSLLGCLLVVLSVVGVVIGSVDVENDFVSFSFDEATGDFILFVFILKFLFYYF